MFAQRFSNFLENMLDEENFLCLYKRINIFTSMNLI